MRYIKEERVGDTLLTGFMGEGGEWFFGYSKTVPTPSHIKVAKVKEATIAKDNTDEVISNDSDICTKCKALHISNSNMCKYCGLKSLLNSFG